jgi:hypothetical protein
MDGWYEAEVVECAGCGAIVDGSPKGADGRHKLLLHDTRPADNPLPELPM